ncbi:GFRA2 protein, partial [Nyctiprogne leucopyga]|nr:GFRA2 protein [Nyctiprogne leucopyga]
LHLDEILHSLAGPPSPAGQDPHGWRVPVDCVRANELCAAEPSCSSRYRTLRQCLAGRDRNTMLANKECQVALEVLQESPLYDCRCKRGMKKELQCLQIYWSIHLGLTEGEEFYEASPYEPVTSRLSDIFRLASIFSAKGEACGSCFGFLLQAGNVGFFGQQRGCCSTQGFGFSKHPKSSIFLFKHPALAVGLQSFALTLFSPHDGMLWACALLGSELAREGPIPSTPLPAPAPRLTSLCLQLQKCLEAVTYLGSRLADFHTNCQATFQSLTSCPGDNYQACLGSYAGLIGFDMTPNYVDASTTSITISPWCSCKGSGNMEEECEKFLQDFTENPCLRNAIQAFGNGTDVNLSPKNPSPPVTLPPKMEKSPALPDDINDSNTMYDTSVITTCTSIQEHGAKLNKSKEQSLCYSETQLTTDIMPDQKTFVDQKAGGSQHWEGQILPVVPIVLLQLVL